MKQPEALRLAGYLDDCNRLDLTLPEAAAELRRLHQSEREGWRYAEELEQERKRLNEANQAMLAALKDLEQTAGIALLHNDPVRFRARAAIAKGEQS